MCIDHGSEEECDDLYKKAQELSSELKRRKEEREVRKNAII